NRRYRWGLGTIVLLTGVLLLAIPAVSATNWAASSATPPPPLTHAKCAINVGGIPQFATYDPVNHDLFVPNQGTANLSIISGCKVIATVTFPAGAQTWGSGFDPQTNRVWVADGVLGQIYVLSGTGTIVKTITSATFAHPWGIAFDPAAGLMAVTNRNSNTVTFLRGTAVVGTTTVGSGPFMMVYDPTGSRLLVTNRLSANVTSLDAALPMDESLNINIAVGSGPNGIAYDPVDSDVYVANLISDTLSVINGVGTVVGTVTVGTSPTWAVWDQSKLSVYVTNIGSNTVSEVRGLSVVYTIHGPSGAHFNGIAYDDANDRVYVTGAFVAKVYEYS
ncbi:MAG: YncE family protein, partial [Thermoplasmata archaeon]